MTLKLSTYAAKIELNFHAAYAIKKHWNPLEFHKASAPEPSGTSQGICTGPSGTSPSIFSAKTLQNLTKSLHRNLPNLARYLPRNHPEPHHASSPKPSGTSSGSCTGN